MHVVEEQDEERRSARSGRRDTGRCRSRAPRGGGPEASTRRPRPRVGSAVAARGRRSGRDQRADEADRAEEEERRLQRRPRRSRPAAQRRQRAADRNRGLPHAEREPSLPRRNQCMTARPLAELTLAPMPPGNGQQHDERQKSSPQPAAATSTPQSPSPLASTNRSPTRSASEPPGRAASGSARPRRSTSTMPTSVSDRSYSLAQRRREHRAGRSGPRRSSPAPPCRPRGRPSGSGVL